MGAKYSNNKSENKAVVDISANFDQKSFNYAMRFLKSYMKSMEKVLKSVTANANVKPELGTGEMAAAESPSKSSITPVDLSAYSISKIKEPLKENYKLLQKFNDEFNITGIVGMYAFRRIARMGETLIRSMIELTIETQRNEKGFSSLANSIETLNSRVTDIKKNLGSSISTVLEPLFRILGHIAGYISEFTSGLARIPQPMKTILGLITLVVIILPSAISLLMVFKYYMSKITWTLLKQATAGSAAIAWVIKYRAAIASTISIVSLAIVMLLSLYSLFSDVSQDASKSQKNLGLANFDDVNTLSKSAASEVEEVTEKTQKLYKVVSGILAVITGIVLAFKLMLTFGSVLGFAGFTKVTSVLQIFTNPTLLAGVLVITAAIAAIVVTIKKFIDVVSKLKENTDKLSKGTRIISWILAIASALTAVAGAILMIKGALSGNWANVGIGAVMAGVGIGGLFGTEAFVDYQLSKVPAAAHGGVTSGATIAMVGEGKYNEAIMPLGNSPEFSEMKQDITNAVLAGLSVQGGRSNQPINITINVDEDYIYRSYNKVAKQNGR